MKFRSDPGSVRGSMAALITPFNADGALDEASLRSLVRWQVDAGSHGISIGGSTGEPSAQSVAERAAAIRIVADEVDDRVPFLPGTGSAKLDETLELTGIAQQAGADMALVITPYYARPTQDALYRWYSIVASEYRDLPIAAYNVPTRTAVEIAPDTIARLFRDHDNFVGVKETTNDFAHFSRVLHAAGPELLVWSGIELLCLPLLALGGVGFVSALANIAPTAVAEMYDAAQACDFDRAREIHYGVHDLADLLFVETNPAPVKWLMAQRGIIADPMVRPPLIPLSEIGQLRVRELAQSGQRYLTNGDHR